MPSHVVVRFAWKLYTHNSRSMGMCVVCGGRKNVCINRTMQSNVQTRFADVVLRSQDRRGKEDDADKHWRMDLQSLFLLSPHHQSHSAWIWQSIWKVPANEKLLRTYHSMPCMHAGGGVQWTERTPGDQVLNYLNVEGQRERGRKSVRHNISSDVTPITRP